MDRETARRLIQFRIEALDALHEPSEATGWRNETTGTLRAVFGIDHPTVAALAHTRFSPNVSPAKDESRQRYFAGGKRAAGGILRGALVEADTLPSTSAQPAESDTGKQSGSSELSAPPRIFLTHGSAEDVLDAVAHFIDDDLGFQAVIMKRSPTRGAAVDDAVPALMDSCDAVVILATADDEQSDTTFNPRPNVIHEIGLAQSKMPDRIVYLKESGAVFPSNVQPKLWESFERGSYGPVFSKLVREFRAFGFF